MTTDNRAFVFKNGNDLPREAEITGISTHTHGAMVEVHVHFKHQGMRGEVLAAKDGTCKSLKPCVGCIRNCEDMKRKLLASVKGALIDAGFSLPQKQQQVA